MLGKIILFALKRSPTIATLSAAAWAGNKIYNYLTEKHVQAIEFNEVKKTYKDREMFQLFSYDFSKNKEDLAKITFFKTVDDIDTLNVAFFEFEGTLVSIQKYQQSSKYTYGIYLDFVSASKAETTDLVQWGRDFISTMNLSSERIMNINDDVDSDFSKWQKNKQKETPENTSEE